MEKINETDNFFQKKPSALEEIMNKYNPVLSARYDGREYLAHNEESMPFPYTEEDHTYDRFGL